MPKTPIIPSKSERALAKIIARESTGVRVTFGRTNGRTVLHADGYTLKNDAEWEDCPLNNSNKPGAPSVAREQEINDLNESIANREAQ